VVLHDSCLFNCKGCRLVVSVSSPIQSTTLSEVVYTVCEAMRAPGLSGVIGAENSASRHDSYMMLQTGT